MDLQKKRVLILGPTASGKTDLAVRLARETNGEIISADSRQCYKRIDKGTAKPDPEQRQEIPHYNISILGLEEKDSAVRFRQRADLWQQEIRQRGRQIILAGGSTLHLQALIRPMDPLPETDAANVTHLEDQAEQKGLETLFSKLHEIDPDYAETMDGYNRQRIIRAMDVWMQTGRPFSSFHNKQELRPPDDLLVYGIRWPRQELHSRINRRVDRMIEEGLVEETRSILNDGYSPDLQSLQSVGYRDAIEYLNGNVNHERMVANMKTHSRRYAKRQITWFRRWPFIQWLDAKKMSADQMVEEIMHRLLLVAE